MAYRAAVLTVSDLGARGEREDTAGPAVAGILLGAGFEVTERAILPDEPDTVAGIFRRWSDDVGVDLIAAAGGTGLSPRDRTPEATLEVIDYRVPGMEEAMRAAGRASTPMAMLSRAVVGVRGRTLIVDLPGSERGARESLEALLPVLQHACGSLRGDEAEVAATHDELRDGTRRA